MTLVQLEKTGCEEEPHLLTDNTQPAGIEQCLRTSNIFKALGDVNRLRLLSMLAVKEMCVSELTLRLDDNLPAISQRLKLLRSEGLVLTRRQGKHIFYRVANEHIAQLIANGLAHGDKSRG